MKNKQVSGFTLIELMVVVAIIGILAAIAYPNYQDYVLRSRRGAAQAHLMLIAQKQQQYFLDNRSFAPDTATLGVTEPPDVSPYYTINFTNVAGPPVGFVIDAAPKGAQARNSEPTLTIDNTGAKTPSGTAYGAW